ncbi:hypothetical protein CGRA01v4_06085 [Colletotrichum graminicola]|nr:hypothetical protein CGRA01v4_06085 [Colletotrichum graminicola]
MVTRDFHLLLHFFLESVPSHLSPPLSKETHHSYVISSLPRFAWAIFLLARSLSLRLVVSCPSSSSSFAAQWEQSSGLDQSLFCATEGATVHGVVIVPSLRSLQKHQKSPFHQRGPLCQIHAQLSTHFAPVCLPVISFRGDGQVDSVATRYLDPKSVETNRRRSLHRTHIPPPAKKRKTPAPGLFPPS